MRPSSQSMWSGVGEAWAALSTLIAGIGVWGGIGFGLDHLLGTRPVLFVIGALAGNFGAIYLIYVKQFPRRSEAEAQGGPPRAT